MRILVDADACPVKEIIVKIAKEFNIEVHMYTDTSHELFDGYSKIVVVDQGRDSVDFAIINNINKSDIVVTQDYGVAAMALSKGSYAINQNGRVYDNSNIDRLLFERHINKKARNAGGKTTNSKKRTKENDIKFEKSFKKMILSILDDKQGVK